VAVGSDHLKSSYEMMMIVMMMKRRRVMRVRMMVVVMNGDGWIDRYHA
jgi:hypothetical protein